MMDFRKASQAFEEARMRYTSQREAPAQWDMLLGLDAMTQDLHRRLTRIEANQQKILQLLQRPRTVR